MKTILLDDELIAMDQFEQECRDIKEIEIVGKFENAEDAYNYAKDNRVEFALVDICLPQMDGIEFGRRLKKLYPDVILIYVTGYSRYALDTFAIRADYCVMKPYTKEDVCDVLSRAMLLSKRLKNKVRICTLPRFEVFIDEAPLHFGNSKAKELLAYCTYRDGAIVTMEEAIDVLWPERPYDDKVKRLYRKAIASIQTLFNEKNIQDIFVSKRGICYLNLGKVDCDVRGLNPQITDGERDLLLQEGYMVEYSWAEDRNAFLANHMYD